MTEFYVVRHGETAWNAEARIQGHTDVPLTPKGIDQARRAGQRLSCEQFDAVYASDLARAFVTGEEIAAPHGMKVVPTPLLREANLGQWQGMTLKEVAEQYPEQHAAYVKDSIGHRPPGAERLEEVIDRCKQFISFAVENHPTGRLAVAAHGGSVRGLIAAALGLGPELYRKIRMDNGSITVFEVTGDRTVLKQLNDTCHLTSENVGDGADSATEEEECSKTNTTG
jgi:alpha-ribazole phosphatase/probable phosphoglycerate mutase